MKLLLVLLGLFLVPGMVLAQTSGGPAEQVVGQMMSSATYDGASEKLVGRMGDATAVVVIKILGEGNVGPNDLENILALVHLSFSAPLMVEVPEDRKPRAALFLLKSLASVTTDQKLKQRITEERKFIIDQYKKSTKGSTP